MDESTTFALATLAVVVGLAILLVGVYQTAGQAVNTPMIAGGVVILAGLGALTAGVLGLEDPHEGEEHGSDEGRAGDV